MIYLKNKMNLYYLFLLKFFLFFLTANLIPNDTIILQSTTSTKNSGFYDYILPEFQAISGIKVNVVAVGTGAAIRNAKNCDGDVLIAHSPIMERELVSLGYSKFRYEFMFNDYVIIGPSLDSAKIRGLKNPTTAIKKIFKTESVFLSRGDSSGTHIKEKSLWKKIGINPQKYSGKWYLETGTSMGTTINTAIGLGGYTLTDRATWINFGNKKDFSILVAGHDSLHNPYGIIAINNDKCPNTKFEKSLIFIKWLLSKKGQKLIASYKINGEQLFFPALE